MPANTAGNQLGEWRRLVPLRVIRPHTDALRREKMGQAQVNPTKLRRLNRLAIFPVGRSFFLLSLQLSGKFLHSAQLIELGLEPIDQLRRRHLIHKNINFKLSNYPLTRFNDCFS